MINIETTQKSFLLRYVAILILLTEVLMIFTIMVLIYSNGATVPTFVMLFLSPLLGGIMAGKISKKNKKVLFKESFNKYFIITNIVTYLFIYFFNFRLNITLLIIYIIGAVIGFLSANKAITKIRNNIEIEKQNNEEFTNEEKILVKQFKLEKFNSENIRKFLVMNNLEDNNYLLAQIVPSAKDYILYGYFSLSKYSQYILHFDEQKLYFFELSRISNKSIENGYVIKFEDMQINKAKKGLVNYNIKIEFKDGNKVNMQIPKKVIKIYTQKQYSEKLFNKFNEIKNIK